MPDAVPASGRADVQNAPCLTSSRRTTPISSPSTAWTANALFVGRRSELALLSGKLEDSFHGLGSLTMLVGEAGIGKTRIAREFAALARERGTLVLWGCCFEGDWQPPYGPWVEALGESVRGAEPERLRRLLGPGAPALAQLVPEVRAALPDTPDPPTPSPDEERLRLYDTVIQFLLALARQRPVVVVLDDLHWADRDSLRLLGYLARFIDRARLLVVGAYRETDLELHRQHPLIDLLAMLRREPGYRHMVVRGLSDGEVAEYLAKAAQRELPAALVRAVCRETDGNPFCVREVFQHLAEEGKLVERRGELPRDWGSADLGVPEGVRQVIRKRLSRLSAETSTLLRLAAGFGGGFAFPVLQALSDLPEGLLLDCLDEALRAGLIRLTEGMPPGYDFAHSILRRTLYDELNPDRRARLHRQIAMALEHAYAGQESEHAAELAAQYHASAGLPGAAEGLSYALKAAEQARAGAALERTVVFLRMARDLSAKGEPEVRAEVLCKLAIAEAEALMLEEAQRSVEEALAALEERGANVCARAEFIAVVARALRDGGTESSVWLPLVERGLALVGDRRDLTWARLMLLCERFEPVAQGEINASRWVGLDAQAVAIARASGDEDDYVRTLATFEWRTREETMAVAALARTWQRPTAIMGALAVIARDLIFYHGAYDEAECRLRELLATATRYGSLPLQAEALCKLVSPQLVFGHLALARRSIQRAHEMVIRLGARHCLRGFEIGQAANLAYYLEGDWASLASMSSRFAVEPGFITNPYGLIAAAQAAFCYSRAGNEVEARRYLAVVTPIAEHMAPTMFGQNALVSLAGSAVWDLGAVELAAGYRRMALDLMTAQAGSTPLGPHEITVARMAALLGDLDEAREYFARARHALESCHMQHTRATVDYDEAIALIRAGSPDRARVATLLHGALEVFRRMGMEGWTKRLLAHKHGLVAPSRIVARANHSWPDGLTEREAAVLRLIAAGRANKEIAAELVLSAATVERHITNIYHKIGARGRADATAYAFSRGLATP